jgi:hypothetical protein
MPDILHKYFSSVWQHLPNFCWNQRISCGLVWNDSAELLSVTIKIILALFYGRLKDGVGNKYIYSLQTYMKGVWNKSWLIRKNKIVEVQYKNEAVSICWTNITVILTYCLLANFLLLECWYQYECWWRYVKDLHHLFCFVLFSFLSWECWSK